MNIKNNQRGFGVILSYLSIFVSFIIGTFYTPYAIKALGQSDYGNYYYVSSIVSYISLLTFGFGSAYLKFVTPYKIKKDIEGEARINGMFLTLFFIMGAVALIVGGIMVFNSDSILGNKLTEYELITGKRLMAIMVVNLFLTFPISVFNSYIIAQERFVYQKLIALCSSVLTPILSIVILSKGFGSIGMAYITVAVNIVMNTITVIYCFKKLGMHLKFSFKDILQFKEIFIFSSFILISMLVDQINWSVDKFLLGKICGTAAVAIYNVAATINTYYKTVGEAISNVYVPKVHNIVNSENCDQDATKLMIRLGRIQMIILGLILTGFIILGRQFIALWVGSEYKDAYLIIIILLGSVTIPEIQKIGLEIQRAKNLHKFRSVVYLIVAIINIIISIPLCYRFGAVGAAIGTAITVIIGNGLIMNIYYYKVVGIDIKLFWKKISNLLLPVGLSTIIGMLLFSFTKLASWLSFITSILIYVIIYLSLIILLGINNEEKNYLYKFFANKKLRLK